MYKISNAIERTVLMYTAANLMNGKDALTEARFRVMRAVLDDIAAGTWPTECHAGPDCTCSQKTTREALAGELLTLIISGAVQNFITDTQPFTAIAELFGFAPGGKGQALDVHMTGEGMGDGYAEYKVVVTAIGGTHRATVNVLVEDTTKDDVRGHGEPAPNDDTTSGVGDTAPPETATPQTAPDADNGVPVNPVSDSTEAATVKATSRAFIAQAFQGHHGG